MSAVREYAAAMRAAMERSGLDPRHAMDAANNLAMPLALDGTIDVADAVRDRLRHQRRHFGLVASDVEVEAHALAASLVPRPTV